MQFGIRVGHPDDSEGTKAKTLVEWKNWFNWYMSQGDMDNPLLGPKVTWCPFEVLPTPPEPYTSNSKPLFITHSSMAWP